MGGAKVNRFILKLNPYKDINIASMDHKPLSPYSELNNYMKEPFLAWADKFLDAVERELNDDFQLVVAGEAFETAFLHDLQKNVNTCIAFEQEKFQIGLTVDERYTLIHDLADQYQVSVNQEAFKMPVYIDSSVREKLHLSADKVTDTTIENASLFITSDRNSINEMLECQSGKTANAKIILLVSDQSEITCVGGMQYVWEVEEMKLNEIVNVILQRFVQVPMIAAYAGELEQKRNQMNIEEAENLSLATEIDLFVTVDFTDQIEVGKTVTPSCHAVPKGNALPDLRMESSNPNVIRVEGDSLVALSVGKSMIEFFKAEELIPFAKKEVVTYQEHFVKEIKLELTESEMGIDRQQQVQIAVIPEDAEDVAKVRWSVDREDLAEINQSGMLVTKKSGTVIITAKTPRVEQHITVTILPNIETIVLSESQINLYVGQTQKIEATLQPENVYHSEVEWKTSDKNVAVFSKLDDGTDIIRATGIGDCVLTCVAKEGDSQAVCNVKVESTFKKRENIHTALSATAVCMVIALFCAGFSFSIGAYAAAIATLICGVQAIRKNKGDRLWAIILMVIALFAAL